MHRLRYFNLRLVALASLCLAAIGLHAQTVSPSESQIAQVTLYPGSATVERVVRVAAGTKKLVIACLPGNLDVQSLEVSADTSVRVGEFSALAEARDNVPACATGPLDARIRELEDKKAALVTEVDALALVDSYLRGVATPNGATGHTTTATLADPKLLSAMADALRRNSTETGTRRNQVLRQQEAIDLALKPLLAERSRSQAGRTRVLSVAVTLDAPRDAELRLRYEVKGPGWAPTYRAMLDTASSTLRLERLALVAQNSGEDWRGVRMRLSTGQPRQGTTGPEPAQWRVGIVAPPVAVARASVYPVSALVTASPAPMSPSDDQGAPSFDVASFDNRFATEFAVPQPIDLLSGGQRVTLSLGTLQANAQLFARTSPQEDASAWLVAELAQPEGVWPAGPMQLYRDGAFVGTDSLRTGAAGPLTLSFGRDDLVVVKVEADKDKRASAGFVGSRAVRSTARVYTIENRHRGPIALQVLEAVPVSTDEKLAIKAQFDPQPTTLAWKERDGLALWGTRLEAGKSARFSAVYEISYSKDAQLEESRYR